MEALGLALLAEVGEGLRRMLREARQNAQRGQTARSAIVAFMDYLSRNANHFRLLLGERDGASTAFRESIRGELAIFARELSEDFARGFTDSTEPVLYPDLAAGIVVAIFLKTGAEVVDSPAPARQAIAPRLEAEVRLVLRGARSPAPEAG
jgi:hypothetical protein